MIVLVRHALAVPRAKWDGEPAVRPLTPRGRRQADALATMLAQYRGELVSSPAARCTETLRPLASARDTKLTTSKKLAEGRGSHSLELVLDADRNHDGNVIVCTHGDVIDDVLRGLRHDGWPVPRRPRKAKGSVWLLTQACCSYLEPGA